VKIIITALIALTSLNLWSAETEKNSEKSEQKASELVKKEIPTPNQDHPYRFSFGLQYSRLEVLTPDGGDEYIDMPGIQLGVRLYDHLWLESSFKKSKVNNFPSEGLDTDLTVITPRLSYSISLPFGGMQLHPYLGYQFNSAKSSGAGKPAGGTIFGTFVQLSDEFNQEIQLVEDQAKDKFIFGFSVAKTFKSRWFARADFEVEHQALSLGLFF